MRFAGEESAKREGAGIGKLKHRGARFIHEVRDIYYIGYLKSFWTRIQAKLLHCLAGMQIFRQHIDLTISEHHT